MNIIKYLRDVFAYKKGQQKSVIKMKHTTGTIDLGDCYYETTVRGDIDDWLYEHIRGDFMLVTGASPSLVPIRGIKNVYFKTTEQEVEVYE